MFCSRTCRCRFGSYRWGADSPAAPAYFCICPGRLCRAAKGLICYCTPFTKLGNNLLCLSRNLLLSGNIMLCLVCLVRQNERAGLLGAYAHLKVVPGRTPASAKKQASASRSVDCFRSPDRIPTTLWSVTGINPATARIVSTGCRWWPFLFHSAGLQAALSGPFSMHSRDRQCRLDRFHFQFR